MLRVREKKMSQQRQYVHPRTWMVNIAFDMDHYTILPLQSIQVGNLEPDQGIVMGGRQRDETIIGLAY